MKKYRIPSTILSVTFLSLSFPSAPAKAFVFENYWQSGIMAWCQKGCWNYYYWYEKNTLKDHQYACDPAKHWCGEDTGGAEIRIRFTNGSTLFCKDIDIGKVPAGGRIRLLQEQVQIYRTLNDRTPMSTTNLDGPGILCK